MRFLVRLAHNGKFSPKDRNGLSKTAWKAVSGYGVDIGNLRVGTKAVELDLLIESETGLGEARRALEDSVGPILTFRKLDGESDLGDKYEAIRVGLALFDEERYWESHEALEHAWRRSSGEEKEVLQGIILLAAAQVHWQKNEKEVTLSIMKRALAKLATHTDYFGVDLGFVRSKINEILDSAKPEFFKIRSQ